MEFDKKYVFHIPIYKFLKMNLIPIEYEEILDVLIDRFNQMAMIVYILQK